MFISYFQSLIILLKRYYCIPNLLNIKKTTYRIIDLSSYKVLFNFLPTRQIKSSNVLRSQMRNERASSHVTLGPGSPGVPGGPIGPADPGVPFSPGGPTSPGAPCLPSWPGRPSAPGGPGGPGGPGSPGSPCYVSNSVTSLPLSSGESPRQECLSVLVGLCHGRRKRERERDRGRGGGKEQSEKNRRW